MFKTLTIAILLIANFAFAETKTVRETAIEKAVAKQEARHFELHRFYIPTTQGNLQWLAATVGAKPDEAILVWKLMRDWDSRQKTTVAVVEPAALD